ncbi:MAG: hypothetical protein JXA42_22140 [Anaerolineales bacterium]|nr:hypothetical protein [Anaerolineales bacterium]
MHGRDRLVGWLLFSVISLLLAACQQTRTITITRVVQTEVTKEIPVEITRIIVQEKEVEATRLVKVTPVPTAIPAGGYVVTTMSEDISTLNPILIADDTSQFISSFIYGGLLEIDPFSGEPVCHFCSSWSSNDRTFTFTLRDDIFWSDGEPVKADDFVYTYAALLWGVANESLDTPNQDLVSGIESVSKIDDRTVAVTMTTNDCTGLDDLILGWLPQHLFGREWQYTEPVTLQGPFGDADDPSFATINNSDMNSAPIISNGPFIFEKWVPGDNVTLVKNPSYFRGAPFLDGIVVRLVTGEAERVRMLRTGEVDLVERFSPAVLTEVQLLESLDIHKVIEDSYFFIGMQMGDPDNPQARWLEDEDTGEMVFNSDHGEHPILSDRLVRQAIAYGLDRYAIITKVATGQGVPLYSNILPSVSWAYNPDLDPYTYDPAQAAALLDEAGWTLNQATGIREKDGQQLVLDLKTNISHEKRVQIGELVQQQLEQLGFVINFESMDWPAFTGILLGQQYDMVVMSWANLGYTPDDSLFFASQNDTLDLGFNFVSYVNTDLDEAWRRAATLNGCKVDERGEIYRQIQAVLYKDLPYNWLYAPVVLIGVNKRLVGVDPGPWNTWYNVESWYLENK